MNGGPERPIQQVPGGRKVVSHPSKTILEPESALRDHLMTELKNLNTAEEAATWAQRVLATKTR
jgi:hypothetical protein